MRRYIRQGAAAGYRPEYIRSLIPRDWWLILTSHSDETRRYKAGGQAPTREEVEDLLEYDRRLSEKNNA